MILVDSLFHTCSSNKAKSMIVVVVTALSLPLRNSKPKTFLSLTVWKCLVCNILFHTVCEMRETGP